MPKVAITVRSEGEGLDAPMDPRFGRADRFLIIDGDTDEVIRAEDNAAAGAAHGAGTGAASLMKTLEVDKVISGRYGPKAFEALAALNIQAWIAPPDLTAAEAIAGLHKGSLERMELKVYR